MKTILIYTFLLFCLPFKVFSLAYFVTLTTDNNPTSPAVGELRWAIQQANANPGFDIISFNISGPCPHLINLTASPVTFITLYITETVFIDGDSQPLNGYTGNLNRIQIKYNNINLGTIFQLNGVNSSNSSILNMDFLKLPTGTASTNGIIINGSNNNLIKGNVFFPSDGTYIHISATSGQTSNNNIIQGNIIGTDNTFQIVTPQPSPMGVSISGNSINNVIGGLNPGEPNLIYNNSCGVGIGDPNSYNTKISGNIFINNNLNVSFANGNNPGGNYNKHPANNFAFTLTNGFQLVGDGSSNDNVEFYLSNSGGIDALSFIGTTSANSSGHFVFTPQMNLSQGDKIICILRDTQNNSSWFSSAVTVPYSNCMQTNIYTNPAPQNGTICASSISFNTSCNNPSASYIWNFGDGTTSAGSAPSHFYQTPGNYLISCTIVNPQMNSTSVSSSIPLTVVNCPLTTCQSCIGSFAPDPGDYVVSLWVKEDNTNASPVPVSSYANTGVQITFSPPLGSPAIPTVYTAFGNSDSPIIDGWQRVETTINIPSAAAQIHIELVNNNSSGIDSYFDDIRIHPIDANMKSYVYDPVTLRLSAELDENNYGTFYEYDEEGKLIRVKKETEKGIMTIKETRSANKKR